MFQETHVSESDACYTLEVQPVFSEVFFKIRELKTSPKN